MMRLATFVLLSSASLALAGCDAAMGRAEFAPPPDRRPGNYPSTVAKETPAPPAWLRYCYRTLAATDCFATPDPNRPGFIGTYPLPGTY